MTDATSPRAPVAPLELRLRYAHAVGDLAPYFAGLERGVAVATLCAGCGRTWFAPRLTCTCGGRSLAWVELSGRGTVVALTRGRATLPGTEVTADFAFALIRHDGADNLSFGRLAPQAARLAPGSTVRLARAAGAWAHPAQCAEYVPEPGTGD